MMRTSVAVLFAAAALFVAPAIAPASLHAQAMVVKKDEPLDPKRAEIKRELLVFRDTLQVVVGSIGQFSRDTRRASDALLRARVLRMSEACAASHRRLPAARTTVERSKGTDGIGGTAQQERRRTALLAALTQLDASLVWCETEFGGLADPKMIDEARYGTLTRSKRVRRDVDAYERALDVYFKGLRIPVLPLGAKVPVLGG
jgi:hypothetical protein